MLGGVTRSLGLTNQLITLTNKLYRKYNNLKLLGITGTVTIQGATILD